MDLRYMGFDQHRNTRAYRFNGVSRGEPTTRFVVTADMRLFLKYRVGIQEGPRLCAQRLDADLLAFRRGDHELTDDDLAAYASARAETEARKTASRKRG
jgi:hypothetical protein